MGAEKVKALPTALIEDFAIIDADNGNVVKIHGGITEGSIVYHDDFVMPFAFVGEDVFQSAQVNEVGDFSVDFFTDLARYSFRAALAEFNAPADRPIKGFVCMCVVAARDEDFVLAAEYAERE